MKARGLSIAPFVVLLVLLAYAQISAQNLAALNAAEKEILRLRQDERLWEASVRELAEFVRQVRSDGHVVPYDHRIVFGFGVTPTPMRRAEFERQLWQATLLGRVSLERAAQITLQADGFTKSYLEIIEERKANSEAALANTKRDLLAKLAERDRLRVAAKGEIEGTAPVQDSSVPQVIRVCEPICGTWTLEGDKYIGVWNNGARAVITYSFSGDTVTFNRRDTAQVGFTAVYQGRISGNKITGTVVWNNNGKTATGPWTGTIEAPRMKY
jgi:hypothetical protein